MPHVLNQFLIAITRLVPWCQGTPNVQSERAELQSHPPTSQAIVSCFVALQAHLKPAQHQTPVLAAIPSACWLQQREHAASVNLSSATSYWRVTTK
jgi:hypothetical protein